MSTTKKVLVEALDGYETRRAQHSKHRAFLLEEMAKTERGIERCTAAIEELTKAIDKAS